MDIPAEINEMVDPATQYQHLGDYGIILFN